MHENFIYGAAKISNLKESAAYKLILKLYENGVTEIDTAPSYGTSEITIGLVQKHFPNLRINTKVGLDLDGTFINEKCKIFIDRYL